MPEEKDDVQEEQEFGDPKDTEEVTDGEQTEETQSTSEGREDTSADEGSESDEQDTLDKGAEGDDELDDSTEEVEKDKVQRRIDRIRGETFTEKARADAAEAELERLRKVADNEKAYSNDQLDQAERTAYQQIQDGEVAKGIALLQDVNKERLKNQENKLTQAYKTDVETVQKQQQAQVKEWASVIERYGPESLPPQYKTNPDFNISDQNSRLFKLSRSYYVDPQLREDYKGSGGQLKAVSDAFLELVKLDSKKKSPTEKKLERKLVKDRRKTSLSGDGVKKTDTPGKQKSSSDLDEYIKDREASTTVKPQGSK